MRDAFARVRGRPSALLAVAIVNLALALITATPLSAALQPHLDENPRAAVWVDGADDGPRLELLQSHPEIVGVALPAALIVIVLFGVASWILAGGALSAFLDGEALFVAAVRQARRMTALGAIGLILRLPAMVALLLGWPLGLALAPRGFAGVVLAAAITLAISGALFSLATVVLDGARGLLLADPALAPFRALLSGVRVLHPRRQLAALAKLALISGAGWLALTALQLSIARALPWAAWPAALLGAAARATLTSLVLVASGSLVARRHD